MSLEASRTPSKIDDIFRVLAGVDDNSDDPDFFEVISIKIKFNKWLPNIHLNIV